MNANKITYRHEKKAVYTRLAIIYTQQRKALDTHKTISYGHDTIWHQLMHVYTMNGAHDKKATH